MNLPPLFQSRIQSQLAGESSAFFESLKVEPPVSIRINPARQINFGNKSVPWCSTGFYLDERPSFTLDPLLHAGCYYVQDASSMFLEQVFRQIKLSDQPLLILDACAAPGGKSTHLASLMHPGSLLISNEVIGSRISVLKENIVKWGNPDVIITNNDPSAFTPLENLFDVILVDAPCSGEGLFRKDPDALNEWSEVNCEINAARQRRILAALLPALKPGGVLIYSTCTLNPAENEENVRWLVDEADLHEISLDLDPSWGIKELNRMGVKGYAFHPHKTKGEGLFISVLRKKEEPFNTVNQKTKSQAFAPLQKKFSVLNSWIRTDNDYVLFQKEEMAFTARERWLPVIHFLSGSLRIVHTGCRIAELKGDKAIPTHELAMSTMLNAAHFPSIALNREEALKFLRKEDFKIEREEKGYTLVLHEGHPLGWINFLGKRFNNYYPANWRIRMR